MKDIANFYFVRIFCYSQKFIPKFLSIFLLKYLNKKISLGSKIHWGSRSLVYFSPTSDVTIGSGTIFSNSILNATLHRKCKIFVLNNASLSIGENSGFSGVSIYCTTKITIGKNLFCGGNVNLWDTDFHEINYDARKNQTRSVFSKAINIGDDVFIGANCTILKGSKIGNRSVLGAGSVLRGKIGEDELWAGNPAAFVIKLR